MEPKASTTPNATTIHMSRQPLPTHLQTATKWGSNFCPTTTLLSKPGLSGPKGNRGRAPNNRPLPPEHIHILPHLQDAGRGKDQKLNPKTGLVHVHRPFRRIPSCLHPPKVSKIPCLHIRQPAPFLSSHAIRVEPGPHHLHQSNHRGAQVPPCRKNSSVCVYRRLDPVEHYPRNAHNKHYLHHYTPTKPGIHNKLEKVPTQPLPHTGIPGSSLGWRGAHSRSQPPQHKQGNHPHLRSPLQRPPHKETLRETVGHTQLCSPVCLPGEVPPATSHPEGTQIQEGKILHSLPNPTPEATLVDQQAKPASSNSHLNSTSATNHLVRRLDHGMGGSNLPRQDRLGKLASRGASPAHQCSRMHGCPQMPPKVQSSSELFNSHQVRQFSSSFPDKQTRFQQEQHPQSNAATYPQPMHSKELVSPSQTHTWTSQHLGRLPLQESYYSRGVVPHTTLLQSPHSEHESGNRPLCSPRQCKTGNIRLPVSPSSRGNSRCSGSELDPVENDLSVPPSGPNPTVPKETQHLPGLRNIHRPAPTFRSLVARLRHPLRSFRRPLRGFSTRAKQTVMGSRRDVSRLSRLQFLRKVFTRKFSPSIATALLSSHRLSTSTQYGSCWKNFQQWLSQHNTLPVSKTTVLQYLVHLGADKHLNPKTILVYRNALHLPLLYGFGINTKDQEFSLLARSQFITNPPKRKIVPNWEPNPVLTMLEQPQFTNNTATTERLLSKTLFLVALATGNRVSELSAFSRASTAFSDNDLQVTIAVRPGFLYKNQTLYRTPPNIIISALPTEDGSPHALCPLDALRHWLKLSSAWGHDAIFINPTSKKPMNRGAISLCLVKTINSAIPGAFAKAHDLRKISASLAWARGVSPHEITQHLFWSSSSTFINKYLVPLRNSSRPCIAAGSSK